ncbi:MAG: SCO family protein [Rhodospirillales bacterium]|nr:SCO family protein [Rhodospirillales bacterium]
MIARPDGPEPMPETRWATPVRLPRRGLVGLLAGLALSAGLPLPAAAGFPPGSDVAGDLPPLAFTMRRSSDGKRVTEADYRGDVVMLYFGFSRCPDVCPLTMHNMAEILRRMGKRAGKMRVLFVTVDPVHDTLPRFKSYLARFGPPPEIDGLRGSSVELAALVKRCFVQYRAPTGPDSPDPVSAITHTSYVYTFGPHGRVRDLLAGAGGPGVDFAAMATGFDRLAQTAGGS